MPYCKCPLKEAAKDAPSSLAFISDEITLTYRELDHLANQFSIKEGALIAVHLPPSHLLIALFFAAWRNNASICPLNLKLPTAQIQSCLDQIKPDLFISSFPFSSNFLVMERPITQSIFLFTSGSTGIPKIAILTLKSLLANAAHSVPLNPADRWLLSLPLYHVGGIGIMLRCVLARAAMVMNKNHPAITHLSFVPTQLYRESPVYKNLKCILLGGAPTSLIPSHLPIYGTYGLTEMGSMVLTQKHPKEIDGQIYLGEPLPTREVRLKPNGEICVRGEPLFEGYLKQGTIESPLNNGWFETGDIGQYHPQGGFSIIGRKDWQFISGGENIQPEEIEQHLLQIPGILEAVVIPKEDPEFGMRPVAVIRTLNPLFTLSQMQQILSDYLPKYKIPIALYHVNEIPKTGLKIDRKQIREIISKIHSNNFLKDPFPMRNHEKPVVFHLRRRFTL